MMRYLVLALLLVCAVLPAAAATNEGKIAIPIPKEGEERKPGPLVVYADDVMFMVKEPEGWFGDLENAKDIGAAVVLYRPEDASKESGTIIHVQVLTKVDENTQEDLNHDMQQFREYHPDVQFRDLKVKHPSYRSFSKIFVIPKQKHDYLTFLNPGKQIPYLFLAVMKTGTKEASKAELQAYRSLVRSIEYISQEGVKPPVHEEGNKEPGK